MSKRDNGVSRRLRWGAGVAAVLVLGTGTAAAHAVWDVRANLDAGPLASGSLNISTQWVGDWPKWKPLVPGNFSDTATLRVTETGAAGTTLRWRLRVIPGVEGPYSSYVSSTVYVGECGSSTIIPTGSSFGPVTGFAPGHSIDLCVRMRLLPEAPSDMQGAQFEPSISVGATQVTP